MLRLQYDFKFTLFVLKEFEIISFIGLSEQNKDNQIQYIAYKKLVSFVGDKGSCFDLFF